MPIVRDRFGTCSTLKKKTQYSNSSKKHCSSNLIVNRKIDDIVDVFVIVFSVVDDVFFDDDGIKAINAAIEVGEKIPICNDRPRPTCSMMPLSTKSHRKNRLATGMKSIAQPKPSQSRTSCVIDAIVLSDSNSPSAVPSDDVK